MLCDPSESREPRHSHLRWATLLDEGKGVAAVARELDLVPSALGQWVKQARADRSKGRTGLTAAERDQAMMNNTKLTILQINDTHGIWSPTPNPRK